MDLAIVEEVLKEILQQQKETTTEIDKGVEVSQELLSKLEEFGKKLDALKVPVNTDVSHVLTPIRGWMEEVKAKIVAHNVPLMHSPRSTFFGDRSKSFYKSILGAGIKGLAILIVGVYSLVVLNRYIREREYLHYKQAWQYLYSSQKEDYKMYLDRIWDESQKGQPQ